jgi:hypothetical protein
MKPQPSDQPVVISYDSGYEHSFEHWLDVQKLVEAVDVEPSKGPISTNPVVTASAQP